MVIKELKPFIKIMEDNQLLELEIEERDHKIKLRKFAFSSNGKMESLEDKNNRLDMVDVFTDVKNDLNLEPDNGFITIKSPRVGTFFFDSSIKEGDSIKKGDVLCFVEAMKLKHEVEAVASGRIISVLVNDAQPVEYGEPLFLLDPNSP